MLVKTPINSFNVIRFQKRLAVTKIALILHSQSA